MGDIRLGTFTRLGLVGKLTLSRVSPLRCGCRFWLLRGVGDIRLGTFTRVGLVGSDSWGEWLSLVDRLLAAVSVGQMADMTVMLAINTQ